MSVKYEDFQLRSRSRPSTTRDFCGIPRIDFEEVLDNLSVLRCNKGGGDSAKPLTDGFGCSLS